MKTKLEMTIDRLLALGHDGDLDLVNEAEAELSALRTELASTQRRLAEAREALEKYGQHKNSCMRGHNRPCECGLDEVLAAEPAAESANEAQKKGKV